jgi:hypothetical protein
MKLTSDSGLYDSADDEYESSGEKEGGKDEEDEHAEPAEPEVDATSDDKSFQEDENNSSEEEDD